MSNDLLNGLRCCTLFWERDLEDAAHHDHAELEHRRAARQSAAGARQEEILVGTSINCSTTCGSRRTAREGHDDEGYFGYFDNLLGNRRTASITSSSRFRLSVNWSSVCGTGEHREFAPSGQGRQDAPRCAAEPEPAAEAPHPALAHSRRP